MGDIYTWMAHFYNEILKIQKTTMHKLPRVIIFHGTCNTTGSNHKIQKGFDDGVKVATTTAGVRMKR
jgi:hypothetical protein